MAITPVVSTSVAPPVIPVMSGAPELPPLTVEQELAVVISECAGAKISKEDLQIQQRKQQIRHDLGKIMLQKLELPEQTLWTSTRKSLALGQDGMEFGIATQCFLLGFFDDLVRRCHLPVKAIEQVMGFLKFLERTPFAKDNGKRLQDVLNHLREFSGVGACLQEEIAQNFHIAMDFFLAVPENEDRTLGFIRFGKKNAEKKPLETCRYIGSHIQMILQQTFAIIDAEIVSIKEKFDPKNIKKIFAELYTQSLRQRLPPAFLEVIQQHKTFYERIERMLRVYQARKKFLMEQYLAFTRLQEETPAIICGQLLPLIARFSKDLSLVGNQIDSLRTACHERLEQFAPCLSKEKITEITSEEKRYFFNPERSPEEEKEQLTVFVTNAAGAAMRLMSSETPASSLPSLEESMKLMSLAQNLDNLTSQFGQLTDSLLSLQKTIEKTEKIKREQTEKLKKELPKVLVQKIEREVALNYRLTFQLDSVLGSFQDSLCILNAWLSDLKKEAKELTPPEPLPISSAFDLLFNTPKVRLLRSTPPASSILLGGTEPVVMPEEIPEQASVPEPVPQIVPEVVDEKKPTLKDLFGCQQNGLLSTLNQQLIANSFSLQSLEHTRLHLGNLRSAAHFLTLNQEPLPSAIVFAIVRCCSLVTEQALTARANFEGFGTTHDQVYLAQELALPVPPILQALRHGVIFHRYPSTSELYLREHDLPTPRALQWLLNQKQVNASDLIELIKETFAALRVVFPHLPQSQDLEGSFCSDEPAAPSIHPFCSRMMVNGMQAAQAAYGRCEKLIETIDAMNGIDEAFQPIKKAICGDIRFSIQRINSALDCVAKFPQTVFLAALGDATLTLIQFLDEHIEKLWHLHSFGVIRISHDLENYRASRDYQESPEHQRILAQFNIGYGAQYPHRYRHETERSPAAIEWRLEVETMSLKGETLDKEALEFERDRKAGYKTVKKKTKKTPATQHLVFASHDRLFEFVSAEAAMAERRLKELSKEIARSSRNDRDHD